MKCNDCKFWIDLKCTDNEEFFNNGEPCCRYHENAEPNWKREAEHLRAIIEGLECDCDGLIIPCQSQICRAKQEARKIKEGV